MKNINMFVYKDECYTVPKKFFINHYIPEIDNEEVRNELYFSIITAQLVKNLQHFFNENDIEYTPEELCEYILTHNSTLIEAFSEF
jgi:hypothetical protein